MLRKYFGVVFICLAGCTVGPKYEPPVMDIPCDWHSDTCELTGYSPDCFLWWESLNDPILTSLIERAAEQNLDLYIAASRIKEARIERKAGDANIYPHIDGSATYGHAQFNQKTLDHILGVSSCNHHKNSDRKNVNIFEAGFDAEWELDLFGANAHEINALNANIQATEEDFNRIWITLSSEVARNYIELRGFQLRLDILNKNIEAQNDTLNLIEGLLDTGFASTIDQFQSQEQLNMLKAEKPQIKLGIDKTIHRLSILLGYAPGDLFCELSQPELLPVLPVQKPIGVPSELLRRRPDIRKAERDLAAATERVGSAVAALFPRFSLCGFVGDISTHLGSPTCAWFAGPQLLQPIFNSTLLKQDVEYNKIKTQQALYEYQKTVLEALEECENAIATFHYELERYQHLAEAEKSSEEAYERMLQLYERGIKDYLEVQVANRSLLQAKNSYLDSQISLLLDYISLYKALGGGWD